MTEDAAYAAEHFEPHTIAATGALGDEFQDEELKNRLLELLPLDGRSRSNSVLIDELGVEKTRYWAVRERLVDEGLAARGRGRGGSTARVLMVPEVPDVALAPEQLAATSPRWAPAAEKELYAPLKEVLRGDWQSDNGYDYLAVEDVSMGGSKSTGGKWTRPDLVAVEVQVYAYLPTKVLSVHTFEVKKASAIDVTAVYEALSHRRASTHSFVLLEVPNEAEPPLELDAVIVEARRHGIGVITFAKADDYATWDERVVAERVEPEPRALNDFLQVQLPGLAQKDLEKYIR
jgi:hypothetical protein